MLNLRGDVLPSANTGSVVDACTVSASSVGTSADIVSATGLRSYRPWHKRGALWALQRIKKRDVLNLVVHVSDDMVS